MAVRPLPSALAAVLAAAACGGTQGGTTSGSTRCDGVEILVAGSDYSSSVVCGAPVCAMGSGTSGADLGGDPQLTEGGGRAFFLARGLDFVFELDPTCGTPKSRFDVKSVAKAAGAVAANPHDAAAAPDGSVWVVLYDVPRIAIVRSGVVESTIDLSSYDDDGNPQAESIRIVEVGGVPKAFVALERLDDQRSLASTRPSSMLRVDVATRTVEAVLPLAGRNPFNPMREADGAFYLAEPGNFDAADEPAAGIERFEAATSTTRILVAEHALGGSVAEVSVSGGCGAAIVAGPVKDVNPTTLVTFDATTGEVTSGAPATPPSALGPTAGYDLQGLAWRGTTLYVGDRRAQGYGYPVHVFERGEHCTLVPMSRTLAIPLPPVSLRAARTP